MEDKVPQLFVPELQLYRLPRLGFDGLGYIVQQIAVLLAGFLHHQRKIGIQILNQDGPGAICHVLAVGVAQQGAVAGGDQKLHVTQRRAIAGVHL